MIQPLHFTDFRPGQTFRSGPHTITAAEIKAFAAQWDPQPFHLDEAAAAGSIFGRLVASGWHTNAVTMRLLVLGGLPIAGGLVGVAVDELRWPRATLPGDTLTVEGEVLEVMPSTSRPGSGRVRIATRTLNQSGEVVQSWVATLVVRG
jgi:acyl dehydratase